MNEASSCEHCGKPVTAEAPAGLCAACLLRTAIEQGADPALVPLFPKLRYFGDYELLDEIARGGMGVVYRARQVSLDRIVAVKMMRPGVLATTEEIRRFQAEARTAAAMQHPNIVAIHEVGEFDGLHYFSMDFVDGPSLAELVRQRPLAPREAARYVQVLAAAVHYAHGRGVLHRDLKPSNVLVDAAGSPRITDFGLARPLDGAGVTVTGTLLGTPAYMPPEQAAAEGARLTAAADCYSLGAILYELLTGRPPFQAASPVALVRMVLEERPAPVRSLQPGVDRDLETICMRCLEKDPARRYQSADALAADLDRFLHGHPLPRRRALPLAAIAAAALVVLGLMCAVLVNRRPAPKHVPPLIASSAPPAKPVPAPVAPPVKKKSAPKPVPSSVGSVTPDHGSGSRQTFTFTYREAPSAVEIEFADDASGRACRLFVEPDADTVSLQLDPERGPGLRLSGKIGGGDTLENAACSVDLSNVAVAHRQGGLEIRLPVIFHRAFAGPREVRSWPLPLKHPADCIRGRWTVR